MTLSPIQIDLRAPGLGVSAPVDHLRLSGVTADSRAVAPGFLYAALPGTQVNGLSFVKAALDKGASALLVPDYAAERLQGCGATVVSSANVRKSWARLVAAFYPAVPSKVISVTGTNGKTSIAHFVRHLLEGCGEPTISAGTLGLEPAGVASLPPLTSPDPVSLFKALTEAKIKGYDRLAIEASSHGLDQGRLDGLQVDAAAFTNLTRDHLDYHVDFPAYAAAKQRLFSQLLKPDGIAIYNADDPVSAQYAALPRRHWTYGWKGQQLRLVASAPTAQGTRLELELFDHSYEIEVPLIGSFQGHNLLAAIGLCHALGSSLDELLALAPTLPSVRGRMELVPTANPARTILVDYAHTPDALKTALLSARPHCQGRLIALFGAGGDRDPGKRPLMGKIAAEYSDLGLVADDNPRTEDPAQIRAQVLAADPRLKDYGARAQAIERAIAQMDDGDLLLIAGKGHETYQEVHGVRQPFDDVAIARDSANSLWGSASQ